MIYRKMRKWYAHYIDVYIFNPTFELDSVGKQHFYYYYSNLYRCMTSIMQHHCNVGPLWMDHFAYRRACKLARTQITRRCDDISKPVDGETFVAACKSFTVVLWIVVNILAVINWNLNDGGATSRCKLYSLKSVEICCEKRLKKMCLWRTRFVCLRIVDE